MENENVFGSNFQIDTESNVAVVICTYNPTWEKLKQTLNSCIIQQGLKVQIIVTDDGSNNNYFDKTVMYFEENKFTNYALVPASENQGTVKNFLKGVKTSTAKYIKPISPGDYLYHETILLDWIAYLEESEKVWSFGDAIYYSQDEIGNQINVVQRAHPQNINIYLSDIWHECRWNYAVLGDIALGAAVISTKEICMEYLRRIEDNVKYVEDSIWKMMMFDGILGAYYPQKVISYEWGVGVSTSNNAIWHKRLCNDWDIANQIMISKVNKEDLLQQKMIKAYKAKKIKYRIIKFFVMPRKWKLLKYKFSKRFMPRKTEMLEGDR